MHNERILEELVMDCPICNKKHVIEKRERQSVCLIKEEEVTFNEIYFLCKEWDEEENEFVPAGVMDVNLLNARDSYRKKKQLLTSQEIKEIRKCYKLTQSEYATLLGWGSVTITRYESKLIQDETYDKIMRLSMENPMFMLECLEKHKSKFSDTRFSIIRSCIVNRINEVGSMYFNQLQIRSKYISFNTPSVYNGNKVLDIEKLSDVIGYFATSVPNLYKVKLMKLLWYADVLFYKKHGSSITGLVYKHMPLGALPIAYDEIVNLPSIRIEEELINAEVAYKILPEHSVPLTSFSSKEVEVLNIIINTFKGFKTKEIVEYMHNEKAYKQTEHQQLISYDLAKELKELR